MSFANRKDLNQLPQSVTVCHYCLQIQFNSSTCSWQTTIFLNKGVGGGGAQIFTNLEQKQKSASNAENTTDLPKTLQLPSLCCFS